MYKNKARIKSGPFIHKSGGVFFIFFSFFLLLTPWGKAPALVWSHFSSAAAPSPLAGVTTIPHTVPCIPEKSVGKFLPLMGTMALTSPRCKQKKMIYVHSKTKKPCMNPHHTYRFFFFSVYRVGSTKLSCPIRVSCCLHAVTGDQVNYSQPLCFNLKGCFILTTDRSICLYWCCHFCRQEWARELDRRYVGNHVSSVSKVYK